MWTRRIPRHTRNIGAIPATIYLEGRQRLEVRLSSRTIITPTPTSTANLSCHRHQPTDTPREYQAEAFPKTITWRNKSRQKRTKE